MQSWQMPNPSIYIWQSLYHNLGLHLSAALDASSKNSRNSKALKQISQYIH
jgi:hypothetical protein